jgi:DNA end-binding protein Ku
MRGKEYVVATTGILRAETMRFHDEVRSPEDVGLPKKEKPAPATVRPIEKLLTEPARASLPQCELKDRASERLKLIARKRKKEETVVGAPASGTKKTEVVEPA